MTKKNYDFLDTPIGAFKLFRSINDTLLNSPDYIILQCEIMGISINDLFWTMLAGVCCNSMYDNVLHLIKDTNFFDELLSDSRLISFIEMVWIGLNPNTSFSYRRTNIGANVGILMDKWDKLIFEHNWKEWQGVNKGHKRNIRLKFKLYDAIFEKRPEIFKQYYDKNISSGMSKILDENTEDFIVFQSILQFFRMFKKKAASGDAKAKAMFEDMARQLVDCI
jgi:hypothetical protein